MFLIRILIMSNTISDEILTKIKEYTQKNKTKICILTPCFGSICHLNYVNSLLNTVNFFKELKVNITIKVEFCRNDSLITRARNNLIARAMSDTTYTHFLFIDNDIQWNPVEIIKLICHDKDIIGGVYPIKKYNWDRLLKQNPENNNYDIIQKMKDSKENSIFKEMFDDEEYIQCKLVNYNLNYLNGQLLVSNNIAKVMHVATGFMLIKRNTIEKMITEYSSTKYTDDVNFLKPEENKYAYALFECGVENETYCSEDWMFCNRWRKMGGDIFIDITINLDHTGICDYKGSYASSIL